MTPWSARGVAQVLGGTGADRPDVGFTRVATDTRALTGGELFVALVGERFDAHRFLEQARDAGARGAVVRHGTPPVGDLVLFAVDDTLSALGTLARARRREITGPVVAVTGSNGKTSTRAMLAAALGTRWRTHATRENLNNLVGVPLTILEAPEDTEALVVECGANLPGELARLREIVEPTVGVVTNVGASHLAGFGSREGVLREKVSLLADVPCAVVGQHPPELAALARRVARRTIVAGVRPGADVAPDRWHVNERGVPVITLQGVQITLALAGRHQAENAMVTLAAALELGLEPAPVADALARVTLPHGRCEVRRAADLELIDDTYNANPASLAAALDVARMLRGNRRLVVLVGTMLELGEESAALHAQMADEIVAAGPDLIGAVGDFVPALARRDLGARLVTAADPDALGAAVAGRLTGGELVLLKASRGVALERAIPHLIRQREQACSTTS
jgi:UDP-N-acetylmuramoyl-tripeptide--D-alanyl-D-alanine ligase